MTESKKDMAWSYYNSIRGSLNPERLLECMTLMTEVKKECKNKKELSKEKAYEIMLTIADKLRTTNPFESRDQFYQMFYQMTDEPDWEALLYNTLKYDRVGSGLVPKVLIEEMFSHIKDTTKTVLIADGERFSENLKATIDEHPDCDFTITSINNLYAKILEKIFTGYKNVKIVTASIYKYGFTNDKFDLIASLPAFGGRDLAEDTKNFMCREYDTVALENLLLHITPSGELLIVMPARITFAGGRVSNLRKFITQMYKLEEIDELPDGILQNTGIKTFLLVIGSGRTDDVTIKRFEAVGQKNKRGPVTQLSVKDDSFAMAEELDDIGDWNIDKLLVQQDEELMKYQSSQTKKIILGEVAEIFRGKSISRKDLNGSIGVVNISDIGQYEINYDGLDKLEEDERKVIKYILQEGDVLIPARGTAIRSAVFHAQPYACIASSNVIVIRPKNDILNSTYLKIFIDSPVGNSLISSLQQGMTVMNISYSDLKMLEIPYPSKEEQDQVAQDYENSYNQYIKSISEANDRWNETLNKLQKF
jgi:type I restriction enzyme M protein